VVFNHQRLVATEEKKSEEETGRKGFYGPFSWPTETSML
jgi:hypothetical protein